MGPLHFQPHGPPAALEEVVENFAVLQAGTEYGHHGAAVHAEPVAAELIAVEVVLEGVVIRRSLEDVGVGDHEITLDALEDARLAHDVDAGDLHLVDLVAVRNVVGAQQLVHALVSLFAEGIVHDQDDGGLVGVRSGLELQFRANHLGIEGGRVEELYPDVAAAGIVEFHHPVFRGQLGHRRT